MEVSGIWIGAQLHQYQTPCSPVRIATRNAKRQIPQNKTTGSSCWSDFSDEAPNADIGVKM